MISFEIGNFFLIPIEIKTFVNFDTNESKVFYILIPIEIHGKFWYQIKGKTFLIPIEIETQLEIETYWYQLKYNVNFEITLTTY